MKPTPPGWPRISSSVCYQDPAKAIDWLCNAFGFEVRLKVEGDDEEGFESRGARRAAANQERNGWR